MKQDVVYILGRGSAWRDNEIRYSLRSLQYLKSKGKVFIVGNLPAWINQEVVTHVAINDESAKGKLLNAMDKITFACHDSRISENFILMNDDFFFLKPVDKIKPYSIGTLQQMKLNHKTKGGYYYKAMTTTIGLIKQSPAYSFEAHYPMVISKTKWLAMIKQTPRDAFLFRSVYGNFVGFPPISYVDRKAFTTKQFTELVQGNFVSTDNATVLDESVRYWFIRRFPNPSIYEDTKRRYETVLSLSYRGFHYPKGVVMPEDVSEEFIYRNRLKVREVIVHPLE